MLKFKFYVWKVQTFDEWLKLAITECQYKKGNDLFSVFYPGMCKNDNTSGYLTYVAYINISNL